MLGYCLVNTNASYRPESRDFMLENKCVLANYDAKEQIDEINEGDEVYIYENRVGIIAAGVATGRVDVRSFEGNAKQRHVMSLLRFKRVEPPIAPPVIREIAQEVGYSGVFFARTVSHFDPEIGKRVAKLAVRRSG